MKNQSTRKLEKDLLKLHTKYFTDTDKLTILHLVSDGKIADAKDMLKPQGVPEKEIDNIIQEYKKIRKNLPKHGEEAINQAPRNQRQNLSSLRPMCVTES